MRIGILEKAYFPEESVAALQTYGVVEFLDGRDLSRFVYDKNILIVRLGHRIDSHFLEMAPQLRVIASATTGTSHFDLEAIEAAGVTPIALQDVTYKMSDVRATPEMTLCLALALLRRLPIAMTTVLHGEWNRPEQAGRELFGLKIGIIGMGRVGQRISTYFEAFGAHIRWFDPHISSPGLRQGRTENVRDLLLVSELVIVCASYRPGQPAVLTSAEIELLTGKYLVNTARGELIDEEALLSAIAQDLLAGVALDVLLFDPVPTNIERWIALASDPKNNVILTPHVSGFTEESLYKAESLLVDQIIAFLEAKRDWD